MHPSVGIKINIPININPQKTPMIGLSQIRKPDSFPVNTSRTKIRRGERGIASRIFDSTWQEMSRKVLATVV
jgi:hypothetical protein